MIKILALITVTVLALSPVGLAQDPAAQQPAGAIIELSLIVTDKDRKPVEKIDKSEIRIVEDKVEQTVLSVERDDRPIVYGLVIDSSGSLRRLIAAAIEAAKMIIINRRGSDEIFIERFISSDKIQTLQEFTTDNTALLESLKLVKLEGGQSAIIDAVYLAADHVAKHNTTAETARKAIVIITDGEDRNSYYKTDALIKLLQDKGIQVFALGLVIDLDETSGFIQKSPRERAQKLLNTLATQSGGRALFPRTGPELIDATSEIINDLRSQFRVTYQSTQVAKKGSRKIDVKVTSPTGEARRVSVHYLAPKDEKTKEKEQKSQ
jgi:Ca-activated chloride channel family protein